MKKITMKNNNLNIDIINQLIADQPARRAITKESHSLFFHLYFYDHASYETADFHRELFSITEDEKLKLAVIVAFRGSGKSTIMTMSYPLWAVLGKQQKKCVVILSKTQYQAKVHFANIKRTLESNELLKQDLGPFQEESDEWGSQSIVIPRFNAKLVAASSEQSIRGIRHGAYRPDLIICDDVEDINSVKTKESRDSTYTWFTGEVLPLGDRNTKYIVVGNLLHSDSTLMRIKANITEYPINTKYLEIPIVDENNQISWPGKYASLDEIEKEKNLMGDDRAWQREYMLKIVADDDQIIMPEWIKYYDETSQKPDGYEATYTAVDLAISQTETSDYTAMVTGHVFGYAENMKIYILPNPVNRRMDFPTTIDEIQNISRINYYNGNRAQIFIEQVAYQASVVQQLKKMGVDAQAFKVHGQDKRARLNSISAMIRQGRVLFPKEGAEDLLQQLLYFGVEKHDDLVDALSMVVLIALDKDIPRAEVGSRGLYDAIRGWSRDYGSDYRIF